MWRSATAAARDRPPAPTPSATRPPAARRRQRTAGISRDVSSLAHLALEDFEAVRLGADEVGFRQRLVGARARRVVMHEFHGPGGMARQQENPVRQIYRLLQVMRD